MEATGRLRRHRVPRAAAQIAAEGTIKLDGLVTRCLDLTRADLAALPRLELPADFNCEDGWTAPRLRWEGVRVSDIVAIGQPLGDARFVRIGRLRGLASI